MVDPKYHGFPYSRKKSDSTAAKNCMRLSEKNFMPVLIKEIGTPYGWRPVKIQSLIALLFSSFGNYALQSTWSTTLPYLNIHLPSHFTRASTGDSLRWTHQEFILIRCGPHFYSTILLSATYRLAETAISAVFVNKGKLLSDFFQHF